MRSALLMLALTTTSNGQCDCKGQGAYLLLESNVTGSELSPLSYLPSPRSFADVDKENIVVPEHDYDLGDISLLCTLRTPHWEGASPLLLLLPCIKFLFRKK